MKKTIRKVLPTIITSIITIALTSCNRQIFDLKYEFKRIHIFDTGECYEISSWRDYSSGQVQVTLKTGETVLLSAGLRFALVETEDCPFEHKGE